MSEEDLFPIDIHYNKLLDWLIDRRHCDSKWHAESKSVKDRVTAALSDLPSSSQLDWVRDMESLGYFDCVRVFESVKAIEGDSTSLFGQYSAPRVKEWWDILKAFEKNNVYLADSAQRLIRLVNYEIPAVKQRMNKCSQTQRECTRKEADMMSNSRVFQNKFLTSCKELGIAGRSVREELALLVAELPRFYTQVIEDLAPALDAMSYYQSFVKHTTIRSCEGDDFLPMLRYVLKHGNVTVFEWKHGHPPPVSQTSTAGRAPAADTETGGDIDWGDEIDFGEPEIDFGESSEVDLSCITVEDSGDVGVVSMESTNQKRDDISIKSEDLESLLASTTTRGLFLNDMYELREFLNQRSRELSHDTSSVLSISQLESDVSTFEMESVESVAEMLGHVTRILDHLTSQRIEHLFLIKGSQRYLERLSEDLLQNYRLSNKAVSSAHHMAAQRELALAQASKLEPVLKKLREQTKLLQTQISGEISKRYKNRVVNIMGEINQI